MFNFISQKISSFFSHISSAFGTLFSLKKIDKETLVELEKILITADVGTVTTKKILADVQAEFQSGTLQTGDDLKDLLRTTLRHMIIQPSVVTSSVYVLVGINGSGKTTCAGKLAHHFAAQGKKVLLVAADTFRAAAVEQLTAWAERSGAALIVGKDDQDPGSVVYQGCQAFKDGGYDILIIDTAGRLQTKRNLMLELEKVSKIVKKSVPDKQITTLLTIDAMLGRNSFDQARIFNEATSVDGIVLTKMDGTGKGGIIISINQELHIPVMYISHGESIDSLTAFDAHAFIDALFE